MPGYEWQTGGLEPGAGCFWHPQTSQTSESSKKPQTSEAAEASKAPETAQTTNSSGWLVNLEFYGMAGSVSSNKAQQYAVGGRRCALALKMIRN